MKIETPDKEVLNAAKMASFNRVAMTVPATNWVAQLVDETLAYEAEHHPRKRARQQKSLERFKAAVGAMAADLLLFSGNEDAQGFMYRPLDRVELSFTIVTADSFEKLVRYWGGLGWLEMTGHINATQDFDGHEMPGYSKARRYRATSQFVDAAQSFQLTPETIADNFEISHRHADLVQLRKANKKRYTHSTRGKTVRLKGPGYDRQLKIMQRLNQHAQAHTYSLKEPPMMRRLFSCVDRKGFNFDLGGRFYCSSSDNWMDMDKTERKHITIDGEATSEIDVSASHLFILYALQGECLDYDPDPYTIDGYGRDIIKQIVVTMTGAGKAPRQWPKDFSKTYKAKYGHRPSVDYKLKDVVAAVLDKHPVLKALTPGALDWANLQFAESECFLSAMLDLHEKHCIASLPVHDSLIFRQSDAPKALDALRHAYVDRFGIAPIMKFNDA